MRWLIDFDDTLAIGYTTWAMQHVIPGMITEYNLTYEETVFSRAMLHAQKQSNQNVDEQVVLDELFIELGWEPKLQKVLISRVYETGYDLKLYEDTLPFLEKLMEQPSNRLLVVSNNNDAPNLAASLGITEYFEAILTPAICGGKPKPTADMYTYIEDKYPAQNGEETVMVGDDPWSDGDFAKVIGAANCYLLDRMDRYAVLYPQEDYHWVHSLKEILSLNSTTSIGRLP